MDDSYLMIFLDARSWCDLLKESSIIDASWHENLNPHSSTVSAALQVWVRISPNPVVHYSLQLTHRVVLWLFTIYHGAFPSRNFGRPTSEKMRLTSSFRTWQLYKHLPFRMFYTNLNGSFFVHVFPLHMGFQVSFCYHRYKYSLRRCLGPNNQP